MLSQIVKRVLDKPDIRLSAELPLDRSVGSLLTDVDADVVIFVSEERTLPPPVRELLGARPRTKVLTMRNDGRETSLYELRPHETDLGQVSPQTLLEAVRTARTAPL